MVRMQTSRNITGGNSARLSLFRNLLRNAASVCHNVASACSPRRNCFPCPCAQQCAVYGVVGLVMQLSRPVLVVLIVICTVVILAANAIVLGGSAASSSAAARHKYSLRRALTNASVTNQLPTLAPSELTAFVGVFTALKPDRRQALRESWFPSSPELLQKSVS